MSDQIHQFVHKIRQLFLYLNKSQVFSRSEPELLRRLTASMPDLFAPLFVLWGSTADRERIRLAGPAGCDHTTDHCLQCGAKPMAAVFSRPCRTWYSLLVESVKTG